jgi:hypothetical protein
MQYLSTTALVLLGARTVAAVGNAFIFNACSANVTVWSVTADTDDLTKVMHVLEPGMNYTEEYQLPSVGGVSLKLATDGKCEGPITQFEYTLDGNIWYDVSNVDCVGDACPFANHGMYLESGKGCPTRSCRAGEVPCSGAYTVYNDDWNSLACDSKDDISLYLCASEKPDDLAKLSADLASASAAKLVKKEEFGIPAHRRRRHVHGHPHVRR